MQEGHSEELAIFQTPAIDTGVESVEWIDFRPVSQLSSSGPIEFVIPSHSTAYLDLAKTRLHVKLRIVKADGNPVAEGNLVGLVNLPLQTLWSQVDVSLQNQIVSPNTGNNYAYKAMVDVLLRNEEDPKLTQLQAQGYFMDTHSYLDDPDPSGGNNNGLLKRWELTKDGAELDLEGPLYADVFDMRRFVLNGVQVNVKLWPNKNDFCLMSAEADADYRVRITDAVLKLCTVKVNPAVLIGHGEGLEKAPAIYPFTKTDIRTFAVAAGQYTVSVEDIFQGSVPTSLIVGLISSEAYSGNLKRNPFNFQHMNCSYLALYVDGQSKPAHPLQPNFEKGNFVEAYLTLFTGTGKYRTNSGNFISREEYPEGYTLYVIDVEGKSGNVEHSYPKRGHTRLELRFGAPLPEATTIILYGTFPGTFQIDRARSIRL